MVEYLIEAQMTLVRFQEEAPKKIMFILKKVNKSFFHSHSFFLKSKKKRVLKNINLNIKNGFNFIGIIGGNGSGKSTLLSLLSGFTICDSGDVIFKLYNKEWKNKELRKLSYFVHDKLYKLENKNFVKNILFFNEIFNLKYNLYKNSFYRYLLKCFQINKKFSTQSSKYSKGMIQKLNLIKALILRKIIYCFDEPLQGLDESSISQFINILKFKKELITRDRNNYSVFLFTSHNKRFLFEVCNYFIVLENGNFVKSIKKNNVCNTTIITFKITDKSKILFIENMFISLLKEQNLANCSFFLRKENNNHFLICYIKEMNRYYDIEDINLLILKVLKFKNIIKLFKLEYNFIGY